MAEELCSLHLHVPDGCKICLERFLSWLAAKKYTINDLEIPGFQKVFSVLGLESVIAGINTVECEEVNDATVKVVVRLAYHAAGLKSLHLGRIAGNSQMFEEIVALLCFRLFIPNVMFFLL